MCKRKRKGERERKSERGDSMFRQIVCCERKSREENVYRIVEPDFSLSKTVHSIIFLYTSETLTIPSKNNALLS